MSLLFLIHIICLLSNKYQIDGGDMTFTSIAINDQGLYQCVVENEFGSISSSAVLTVEAGKHCTPSGKTSKSLTIATTKYGVLERGIL